MTQTSKKRYTVEVTVEVEADQQPDPEDFVFDTSKTAADIGVELVSESWSIYEEGRLP